jgi:hypothetical protein
VRHGDRLLFAIDEAGFWGADVGSICAMRGDVLELLRSGVSASAMHWGTAVSAVSERGQQVEVSFYPPKSHRDIQNPTTPGPLTLIGSRAME